MRVPRPAGLTGPEPPPVLDGLAEADDIDLVGPSGEDIVIEAEGPDGIVVLVERDGVLSWYLPDPANDPSEVVVPVPEGTSGPAGLIGEVVATKLRTVVYRFAAETLAGLTARAVVAVLEGRRAEGPVHIIGAEPSHWLPTQDLGHLVDHEPKRLLLLIHGTFSSTRGSFAGLVDEIGMLRSGYDLVLGFDHATLGRSPSENAERIASHLVETGWAPQRIDVVAYSRGGLVARALLRRLPSAWQDAVRTLIFVACPNQGTPLASPRRWVDLLDRTTNLASAVLSVARYNPAWTAPAVALDEVFSGMGVLLRAIATRTLSPGDVPGLAAMDPDGQWLAHLDNAPADSVRYLGLAVDHEPQGAFAALGDVTVDAFMGRANDLVVPVDSVAIEGLEVDLTQLPDASVHHLTIVRESAGRLATMLSLAAPVGLVDAASQDASPELDRAEAIRTIRGELARYPSALPDDVAQRILDLEEQFPGVLDEIRLTQLGPEVGAPPDRFSADAETRTLRRTVRDRFDYHSGAITPTTVGQLWAIMATLGPLRVAGSARSLSQVSDPTGNHLVGTSGLGQRWTDTPPLVASQPANELYWCGAGRTLRGIIGDLVEEGRAIGNIGSGAFQTVAGALSTGTHGSGIELGAFHDQIAALVVLTFVGGRPVVRFVERADAPVCDPDNFAGWAENWARSQGLSPTVVEHLPDNERFRAHVLALGCLGLIVGVALRTVPEYFLHESREPTTWSLAKADLLARVRQHRHYELLISPWPGPDGDHRCLVIERSDTDLNERDGARPLLMRFASEGIARTVVGLAMENAIANPLVRLPNRADTSLDQTTVHRYVDRWDQVLRLNLNMASLTGEYAVPFEGTVAAIDALLALCRQQVADATAYLAANPSDVAGMWRSHPVPAGPIAIRFVAADDALLSPMNGRDSATLEFHHPGSWALDARMVADDPSEDGNGRRARYRAYHEGRQKLMAKAERLLEHHHGGRAHWGLYHTLDRARAEAVYPGFDDWLAVYDEANAKGWFNGRITAALGLDKP